MASLIAATAARKVARPSILTSRSSFEARIRSPRAPSERRAIGPIRPGPPRVSSCGPGPIAEEARRSPVRVVDHAAEHLGADDEHGPCPPGLDLRRRKREGGEEARAGGADVEGPRRPGSEPARDQRRRVRQQPVRGAGRDQDQVEVGGHRTRRARAHRSRPRRPGRPGVSPFTRRRRWIPVREEIHSESTPSGPASSSFSTTRSGSEAATAAIPGPAVRFAPLVAAPVARATSPSGSTSEESTSHCCPGESSGKGRLPVRDDLDLGAVDRPFGRARRAPFRARRPGSASRRAGSSFVSTAVQRIGLTSEAPASRARRRAKKSALVEETTGASGRSERRSRRAPRGRHPRPRPSPRCGRRRRPRASWRARPESLAAASASSIRVQRAGEDELLRGVLVGQRQAVLGGERLGAIAVGADGEHAAGLAGASRIVHDPAPGHDDPQAVGVVDRSGGGEGTDLAERVAGEVIRQPAGRAAHSPRSRRSRRPAGRRPCPPTCARRDPRRPARRQAQGGRGGDPRRASRLDGVPDPLTRKEDR